MPIPLFLSFLKNLRRREVQLQTQVDDIPLRQQVEAAFQRTLRQRQLQQRKAELEAKLAAGLKLRESMVMEMTQSEFKTFLKALSAPLPAMMRPVLDCERFLLGFCSERAG